MIDGMREEWTRDDETNMSLSSNTVLVVEGIGRRWGTYIDFNRSLCEIPLQQLYTYITSESFVDVEIVRNNFQEMKNIRF